MSDLPVLTAEEQRVLGSLLEKEVTVPASYPMTVTAVRTACNQQSSREPVVDYDDDLVHHALRELKRLDLVGVTWEDHGRRTLKYVQTLSVRLGLADDERALLTVLLLRGPQPPGALRTRTERLFAFPDRGAVEACLQRLAEREQPLVQVLPRQPREQDARWVHLLGPLDLPAAGAGSPAPAVDRDAVLAEGAEARDAKVRAAYAAIARPYADALGGELEDLPFERWLLDRVAAHAGAEPVVEVGCGPGHVTAYLAEAGADATGLDLTPEMVEQARERYPDGVYEVGDLRALMRPVNGSGWAAVLAWYSLIHLAASELHGALVALARPMRPGGLLVLALHAGAEVRHHDRWFDHEVDLDVVLHEPAEVVALVERAGLVDVEWYRRGPVAARGETTERLYVVARTPA
ncbi:DUF480 domain-containing protein [Nocardioides nitrophenolicus]|uniref:DUF480 domain-containing protein n=1 Tax=Nocardioides nitrophenolicus TaxID=60489 RepID=UPI00195C5F7A|nr:DUF480 domain-containing protein [Nocardioides nitrophenolicus]MBM7516905.1 uncharacterized protein YceH (UPF0502 family) [Nocardioides nitrophenolicus]